MVAHSFERVTRKLAGANRVASRLLETSSRRKSYPTISSKENKSNRLRPSRCATNYRGWYTEAANGNGIVPRQQLKIPLDDFGGAGTQAQRHTLVRWGTTQLPGSVQYLDSEATNPIPTTHDRRLNFPRCQTDHDGSCLSRCKMLGLYYPSSYLLPVTPPCAHGVRSMH